MERGLFASHDPLEEISAGRYRIRRPEFRPANIPCNSFATTPANVVTQMLWPPGNCLSCTARANLRQVEGSYSVRAAFSSHAKQETSQRSPTAGQDSSPEIPACEPDLARRETVAKGTGITFGFLYIRMLIAVRSYASAMICTFVFIPRELQYARAHEIHMLALFNALRHRSGSETFCFGINACCDFQN